MTQQTVDYYPQFAQIRPLRRRLAAPKSLLHTVLLHVKTSAPSLSTSLKAAAIVLLAALSLGLCLNWQRVEETHFLLRNHVIGMVLLRMSQVFLALNVAALVWQVVLVCRYKPSPTCTDEQLPTCSVIVPAYNEGRQVLETLRSLMASDFPRAKLEIIAVDDGSKDDTWQWMQVACAEFPGRIQAVKMPQNQGKRGALYEGILRSRKEIIVTVDSDSVVLRRTLRRLVSPFFHDPLVGAVAGNVRVLNRYKGLIPQMLDVSFLFSFDFIRAAESEVNTVMCTPGALSAYRKAPVLKVLDEWMKQTFCGQAANHGEDRNLTNLLIRDGQHIKFQRNAVVYTNVPDEYKGLCRMFLRWARSNVRETIVMSKFAFKKYRPTPVLGSQVNLLLMWMSLTITQVFLLLSFMCLFWRPDVFGIQLLLGIAINSALPAALYAVRTRSADAIYAFLYGMYWFFTLSWITPYALITSHRPGWLTRELDDPQPQKQFVGEGPTDLGKAA